MNYSIQVKRTAVLFLLFTTTGGICGQVRKGSDARLGPGIAGFVKEKSGKAIVGAVLTATSKTGSKVITKSDSRGVFVVDLTEGIYSLEVFASGFKPLFTKNHLVSRGGKGQMDFILGKDESTFDLEPCGVTGADCYASELWGGSTEELSIEPTVPSDKVTFRQIEELPPAPNHKLRKRVKKNNN